MVKWTKPARQDMKQIHDYIARDSKYYAKKVIQEIVDKSQRLNDFPKMGRVVPEVGDENVRELFVYSYRLIYQVSDSVVKVLTVVHNKRDFASIKY
ncbi:MAG: type II toxin-antitoxin system RelE/ParE family toxin [Candidatus Parabeggiatoa sp.]|nr:type II toxin-antitoxin system RelE/ParE family toxin [Candidatus Parabeggiatoa sp.]